MKVLLDERIPRKFKFALSGHECQTVPEAGLAGKKNGLLLSLAEQAGFQVLVTLDKGIQYQQNLTGRGIGVVVIRSGSNRLHDLLPHAQSCQTVLSSIGQGEVLRVG